MKEGVVFSTVKVIFVCVLSSENVHGLKTGIGTFLSTLSF